MINNFFNEINLTEVNGKVDEKFNSLVNDYAVKAKNAYNSATFEFNNKECKEPNDFVVAFNEAITLALKDANAVTECKALSILYLTGLNKQRSNIVGVLMCILTAIDKIGSKYDIDVAEVVGNYITDIKDNKVNIEATGSIQDCELFGVKITDNSAYATANDNRYYTRLNALVHDDIKANNKDYFSRNNKFKSLRNKYIKDGLKADEATAKAKEDYIKWMKDGSYDNLKKRRVEDAKRMEAEDNSDDVDF